MRILVISDVHANLTALEAVLASAGSFDATWCLGDLVGYGPDLNECVERIRSLPNLLCIKGNHDQAIAGDVNMEIFNEEAAEAIRVSKALISRSSAEFLRALSEVITNDIATFAHGSPRNPIWEYILDTTMARLNFAVVHTPLTFVGHSHLPLIFTSDANGGKVTGTFAATDAEIPLTLRTILNPGSVGQPRDNDPRASFGIFDSEKQTWMIERVAYDIPSVQKRILEKGLPVRNALRLSAGH